MQLRGLGKEDLLLLRGLFNKDFLSVSVGSKIGWEPSAPVGRVSCGRVQVESLGSRV